MINYNLQRRSFLACDTGRIGLFYFLETLNLPWYRARYTYSISWSTNHEVCKVFFCRKPRKS